MKYLKTKIGGSPSSITLTDNDNIFTIPIELSGKKKKQHVRLVNNILNSTKQHKDFVYSFFDRFKGFNYSKFEFDSEYLKSVSISRKSYLLDVINQKDAITLVDALKKLKLIPSYKDIKEKVILYSSSDDDPTPEPRMAVTPVAVYDLAAIVANAAISANILAGINLIAVYNAAVKTNTKLWKSAATFQSAVVYPPLENILKTIEMKSDTVFAKEVDKEIFEYIVETVQQIVDEFKQRRQLLLQANLKFN